MSNEIVCPQCRDITGSIFVTDYGCFLRKDIYNNWIKGCNYQNTPKSLKKVVDKLLIQSNLREGI